MCLISRFIEFIHEYLIGSKHICGNVVRKHTKKLEELGDLSFPLCIKNWTQYIQKLNLSSADHGSGADNQTIFSYLYPSKQLGECLDDLIKASEGWVLKIDCYKVIDGNVHLFLNRPCAIMNGFKEVNGAGENYGFVKKIFNENIFINIDDDMNIDLHEMNLSQLRLLIVKNVTERIMHGLKNDDLPCVQRYDLKLTLKSDKKTAKNVIKCGVVLNDDGIKDLHTTAKELYKKRTIDMQLMAQHKYGMRVQSESSVDQYFENLGKASVTIEMLQNKPHKAIKVSLNNLQTAHKGPAFICYNCARLSALFKEFNNRIKSNIYPELPALNNVDFTLLNQPEEWELFYVYILQFPLMIRSCISDICNGNVSPHVLTSWLANMCSIFSVYYRRVKILTNGKEHMLQVLFARIYLLQSLQQVFHNSFLLLDIEPIRQM